MVSPEHFKEGPLFKLAMTSDRSLRSAVLASLHGLAVAALVIQGWGLSANGSRLLKKSEQFASMISGGF